MTNKTVKFRHLLMALAFSFTALFGQAQPGGPGDPGPDPDPAIPFDGGISLVVAAGVAYAAKKGFDKRKKMGQDQPSEK